jgi:hypothetical protein
MSSTNRIISNQSNKAIENIKIMVTSLRSYKKQKSWLQCQHMYIGHVTIILYTEISPLTGLKLNLTLFRHPLIDNVLITDKVEQQ